MTTLRHETGPPRGLGLFPTHGQGSLCTASGAGRLTSTLGQEVAESVYKYMGPTNVLSVAPMPERRVPTLTVEDLATQPHDTRIVDVRPRAAQARGILPDALAIEVSTDFGSWTSWLVPRESPIVFVAEPDQDITEPLTQLAQIGVDSVIGVVRELPTDQTTADFELVDLATFQSLMDGADAQVLDVRMPSERAASGLDGSVRRFLPDLLTGGIPIELHRGRPVLIVCRTGRRATVAAGILANQGYRAVVLDDAGVPDLLDADAQRAA